MFERLTPNGRLVITVANDEARRLSHNYIGTEHILLSLIQVKGTASEALMHLGVTLDAAREKVQGIIGRGHESPSGSIPFTPRSKKVLELAMREALSMNHNYIGTEHILLGIIREGEGVAAQVLVKLGFDLPRVRRQVLQELAGPILVVSPGQSMPQNDDPPLPTTREGRLEELRWLLARAARLSDLLQHEQ